MRLQQLSLIMLLLCLTPSKAKAFDCDDVAEIAGQIEFVKKSFLVRMKASLTPKTLVLERPANSGTFVAVAEDTHQPYARITGRIHNGTFFVNAMSVIDQPRTTRTNELSPGAPFRILQYLREQGLVRTVRIQVNTDVFEALRAQTPPLPMREHFIAHWAGFDLIDIDRIPLYNLDEPGHQTWLVFKPAPPENPNDKLKPGYTPRPLDPMFK